MRTVTSYAGEEIVVYTDSEFAHMVAVETGAAPETASERPGAFLLMPEGRLPILRTLWFEGAVEDRKTGRSTSKLYDRTVKFGGTTSLSTGARSSRLAAPALSLCLDTDTNARRTYRISLRALPERWLQAVEEWSAAPPEPEPAPDAGDDDLEAAPAVVEAVAERTLYDEAAASVALDGDTYALDEAVAPPPPIEVPALEIEVANTVATALLTQVVEIIAAGGGDGRVLASVRSEVAHLEERLGEQVAYVSKLRRQLATAGDELGALKLERDGLRRRVKEVEHNLRVATGADAQRIIDAEVRKAVDKLMRQAPANKVEGE